MLICYRILEVGFEDELRQIISILPKEDRQTMLFSATQTTKVEDLARISLKPGPLYINVDHKKEHSTVDGVEQGFIICEAHKRFLLLFSFLKKNAKKKIIVFFSSCNSVKYYSELLNYIDLPVLSLHGKLKQQKRTNTFFEFCNSAQGTLICTDVAARGLDIPAVDYIVQLDPPDDVSLFASFIYIYMFVYMTNRSAARLYPQSRPNGPRQGQGWAKLDVSAAVGGRLHQPSERGTGTCGRV